MADPVVDALSELTTGSRIHLLRGQAAHRAGQFEAAAAQFAAAVEADPESVPARVNLAASLAALGRAQEAASVLEEALALAPGNATAHFNLARLLEFAGDARAAAGQYEEAARYAPRDGEILYHWAETLAREGRLEEAIARYRESISAAPPGERARVGEAIVLSRLGQRVEALGRLEEARSLLPRSRRVARELAWFLATSPTLTLRDGNRAMALATPLHSAQPTLDHAVVLAVALAEAGRCEEASSLLRQALHEAQGVAGEEIQSWRDELERWAAGPPCRPLSG
jgi:Flp pilus assembly protein TadD